MVEGVSWTMKRRWGKEWARVWDAWPVEPPTWLGLDHGRVGMGKGRGVRVSGEERPYIDHHSSVGKGSPVEALY